MKKYLIILLSVFGIGVLSSAQSDPEAIEIANGVMEAMGGEDNWEKTRYLQWNFFGRRMWYWDKATGNVRCEVPADGIRIGMNIIDKSGVVYAHGIVQTHADSLDKYLEMGYRMWINDSYWLVMPFKLQDPGTTIKYMGRNPNTENIECDVLELTFNEVGVTPDNKYLIYVDNASNLVVQWDYFRAYGDDEPRMTTPWSDYQRYQKILLSGGRGKRGMSDIAVHKKLPKALFKDVSSEASKLLP